MSFIEDPRPLHFNLICPMCKVQFSIYSLISIMWMNLMELEIELLNVSEGWPIAND